ncbi:MAG: glycosyltransferase family 4 protein [Roseobacter sp.]
MIHAAFYAPMKPPTHPTPSGDREMARALIAALQNAGIQTDLASELPSRDGRGNPQVQKDIRKAAALEIDRLVAARNSSKWRIWVSYHNYYKAPDLIGPVVSKALGIPYFLIESTRARKRLSGPWADFASAAEVATDTAHTVFYLTQRDAEALRDRRPAHQKLVHLAPFLPQEALPNETDRTGSILSVGMFRAGDKLASYRLVAETLKLLTSQGWHLDIAGDGATRPEVETLMAPFGDRVRLLGALDRDGLQQAYQTARILFWPGVNEAFGMVYLEAQAAGMTVVAQNRPGVCDILAPGAVYPSSDTGPTALAARLDFLLSSPKLTMHLGESARQYVERNHLMPSASATLRHSIEGALA